MQPETQTVSLHENHNGTQHVLSKFGLNGSNEPDETRQAKDVAIVISQLKSTQRRHGSNPPLGRRYGTNGRIGSLPPSENRYASEAAAIDKRAAEVRNELSLRHHLILSYTNLDPTTTHPANTTQGHENNHHNEYHNKNHSQFYNPLEIVRLHKEPFIWAVSSRELLRHLSHKKYQLLTRTNEFSSVVPRSPSQKELLPSFLKVDSDSDKALVASRPSSMHLKPCTSAMDTSSSAGLIDQLKSKYYSSLNASSSSLSTDTSPGSSGIRSLHSREPHSSETENGQVSIKVTCDESSPKPASRAPNEKHDFEDLIGLMTSSPDNPTVIEFQLQPAQHELEYVCAVLESVMRSHESARATELLSLEVELQCRQSGHDLHKECIPAYLEYLVDSERELREVKQRLESQIANPAYALRTSADRALSEIHTSLGRMLHETSARADRLSNRGHVVLPYTLAYTILEIAVRVLLRSIWFLMLPVIILRRLVCVIHDVV